MEMNMFITDAIAAAETTSAVTPSPLFGLLTQLVLVFCIFVKTMQHFGHLERLYRKEEC